MLSIRAKRITQFASHRQFPTSLCLDEDLQSLESQPKIAAAYRHLVSPDQFNRMQDEQVYKARNGANRE
jgi:hypothetical protein